jgi:hypothetical protein
MVLQVSAFSDCRTRTIPTYLAWRQRGSTGDDQPIAHTVGQVGVHVKRRPASGRSRYACYLHPSQLPTDIRFGRDHGRVVRELVAPNTVEWNGCQTPALGN